ncbi:MAG: hypothetical protein AABY01_00065 [Nanoarchaeota archaeon]
MRRSTLFVGLVILLVITSMVTAFYYTNKQLISDYLDPAVIQVITIPMNVKVSEHFGINTDSDALHFGKVPPTNEGIRGFTINSTFNMSVQAELWFSGKIAPWVSASENNIILAPFETKYINITVTVPADATTGTKKGTLHVVFRSIP